MLVLDSRTKDGDPFFVEGGEYQLIVAGDLTDSSDNEIPGGPIRLQILFPDTTDYWVDTDAEFYRDGVKAFITSGGSTYRMYAEKAAGATVHLFPLEKRYNPAAAV